MAEAFETRRVRQLPEAAYVAPGAVVAIDPSDDGPTQKIEVGRLFGQYLAVAATYETAGELAVDLDHADNAIALVYADPDPANSIYWVKQGASGAGVWVRTNIGRGQTGEPGPANSTYSSTAALEAADVTNLSAILTEAGKAGTFTIRAYADFSDEIDADVGRINYVRSTSNATKVWVRTTILAGAAARIGSSSGLGVQSDINARPTSASLADVAGSSLIGFSHAIPYSSGTIGAHLRRTVYVTDAPFNAKGDGVTNDTAAIQAAIDFLPATGGIINFPGGSYAISARLNIRGKPVILRGARLPGSSYQPVQTSGVEIKWIGGVSAGAMIRQGNYGDGGTNTLLYGGVEGISLNGGGVCAHGLELGDMSRGNYRDLYISNVTASGMHFIADNLKANQPSIWNNFYNCRVDLRATLAASANAHGILIDQGTGANGSGITLFYFENLNITHSGGDGIRFLSGGDGFVFMRPQIFRADAETGWSVRNMHSDFATPTNHAIFHYPLLTAGAYFDHAGHHLGTHFHDYDSENLNTGNVELVYGPGSVEVGGVDSRGGALGITRFAGSTQDAIVDDAMHLVHYDSANQVAFTNAGAWKVAAGFAAISAATRVGGALRLSTQAVNNDITIIGNTASAVNGASASMRPMMQFGLEIISTTAVTVIAGFFDNTADPPSDGVWVEYDPAQNGGQYTFKACRGGPVTSIVNTLGLKGDTNPRLRWRICILYNATGESTALFYVSGEGVPNPHLWSFAGSISTNVPTGAVGMQAGFSIRARAAAAKTVAIGDVKLAHRINYL